MSSHNIPSAEERQLAEDAEIATVEASEELPEFLEPAELELVMRSITRDPKAVTAMAYAIAQVPDAAKAIAYGLFAHPEFKKMMAMGFANIYDAFTKMHNNSLDDFEKIFEVKFLDESIGDPKEFFIRYLAEDTFEFYTVDELANKVKFNEPNPGVLKMAKEHFATKGIEPSADHAYLALITVRAVPEVVAATEVVPAEVTIQ
jgi:hypothetical protein